MLKVQAPLMSTQLRSAIPFCSRDAKEKQEVQCLRLYTSRYSSCSISAFLRTENQSKSALKQLALQDFDLGPVTSSKIISQCASCLPSADPCAGNAQRIHHGSAPTLHVHLLC